MRDRLIELVNDNPDIWMSDRTSEMIADYLLANGVIVPPCKVGDTVYEFGFDDGGLFFDPLIEVVESKVEGVLILCTNDFYKIDEFGESVFLTKEEAEQALKEREG